PRPLDHPALRTSGSSPRRTPRAPFALALVGDYIPGPVYRQNVLDAVDKKCDRADVYRDGRIIEPLNDDDRSRFPTVGVLEVKGTAGKLARTPRGEKSQGEACEHRTKAFPKARRRPDAEE